MLDSDDTDTPSTPSNPDSTDTPAPRKRAPRKAAAKKAAPPPAESPAESATDVPAVPAAEEAAPPRKRAPRKAAAKKASAAEAPVAEAPAAEAPVTQAPETQAPAGGDGRPEAPAAGTDAPAKKSAAKKAPTKRATKKAADAASVVEAPASDAPAPEGTGEPVPAKKPARKRTTKKAAETAAGVEPTAEPTGEAPAPALATPGVLFMPPAAEDKPRRRRTAKKAAAPELPEPEPGEADITAAEDLEDQTAEPEDVREAAAEQASGARRRRRRGRRGRGGAKPDGEADEGETTETADAAADAAESADDTEAGDTEAGTRRRRRRRRSGTGDDDSGTDDPANTVTHVREPKPADDGVKAVKGSTRLEAKRQRRRDGRETTRRRAPILTEAEFLARREAVDRIMAVRQTGERTQIAVLEDGILVEHYVTRASATSYVGNVYLGRVQNVLPSMEAAFVDIGKGRNGVLYAGEVNWDAAGLEGKSRAIENALKPGDSVLVQVTKDPIGHKGARLTSQVSLPGRFLVYVPGGGMTGISRRLPDTERHRLKSILKKIVPEDGGVIVRTAAEGASEEDLTRDVERLTAQWEAIQAKAANLKSAPTLVHGEPDLATRVVRDVFNEDFKQLIVQGEQPWQTVSEYVQGVAPDLADRVAKHAKNTDLFADLRVDEQLMKALDRKVWLPSGGSLIIDRTEAMTVIDVNTGKFVGAGGNLEQTVTRNNLEAAEEIVRQLRVRDIGGIVVIDFIDMVLESNRELVLRRLTECLARDRTKHQVAEVTSLGLVQMTRKRIGEGLLEAFSETCEHCKGRGVIVHTEPVERSGNGAAAADDDRPSGKSRRKRGSRGGAAAAAEPEPLPAANEEQRRAAAAAIAAIHRAAAGEDGDEGGDAGGLDALASGLISAAALADYSGRTAEAEGEVETSGAVTAQDDGGFGADASADRAGAEAFQPSGAGEASSDGGSVVSAAVSAADESADRAGAEAFQPSGVGEASSDGGSAVSASDESADDVESAAPAPRRRRRAASRPAGPPSVA